MDQGLQSTASLYDYLYIDKERINALTAQLFSSGVLTHVKNSQTDSDNNSKQFKVKLPVLEGALIAGGAVNESFERHYDSSWSAPLNLLDKLDETGRIKRTLDEAKLGDLVLINGMMKIFDAQMVHTCMPILKKIKTNELKNEKNSSAKAAIKAELQDFENAEEVVKLLPPTTHFDFADSEGNQSWMSVEPSNLTSPMSDISLKYGPFMPGKWHVLGFVDAYSDDAKLDEPEAPYPHLMNDIKVAMDPMLIMMRTLMGRPAGAFGLTPLIIFRSVA